MLQQIDARREYASRHGKEYLHVEWMTRRGELRVADFVRRVAATHAIP